LQTNLYPPSLCNNMVTPASVLIPLMSDEGGASLLLNEVSYVKDVPTV
jgi:hypothetical protein